MTRDERYIQRCLELAAMGGGWVAPNPMVGAVLVANDRIIGEGYHTRFGAPHAEVEAFKSVKNADESAFSEATLYVSLEPCSHYGKTPPCADLIIQKGVRRVVCGMLDPNPLVAGKGIQKLRDAGIEVKVGVLKEECRRLNKRFLCLHEQHRPYIILKWAQTSDGFIDKKRNILPHAKTLRREDKPLVISNALTKRIVHLMRAENMAIMVGTNTVLLDDPRLLVTRCVGRNPIRITLDRHHKLPLSSRIFSDEAPTIVYRERTDWSYIVQDLAARQIHSVLVEGGATLLNHILATGVWDEMHIEVSPVKIGNGVSAPQITLPDMPTEVVENNSIYIIQNNKLP